MISLCFPNSQMVMSESEAEFATVWAGKDSFRLANGCGQLMVVPRLSHVVARNIRTQIDYPAQPINVGLPERLTRAIPHSVLNV